MTASIYIIVMAVFYRNADRQPSLIPDDNSKKSHTKTPDYITSTPATVNFEQRP